MTFVPTHLIHAIFLPGVILDTFSSFLLIYGGLRIGVLGLGSWLLCWGFSVNKVLGLRFGAF